MFSDKESRRAADWEARQGRAPYDLASAVAFGHEVQIVGSTTGHSYRVIAMCDSERRAEIVAEALRAYAEQHSTK